MRPAPCATPVPSGRLHALAATVAAALCCVLAGCGGGGGTDAVPPVGAATGTDAECGPVALPAPRTAPVACAAFDDAARARVLELVNGARAEARRCGTETFDAAPPLEWNPCLEAAAAGHSDDMATHDFFSHTGSDGSQIGMRATAAGFVWFTVGENIAAGQETAARAMTGWIDSPGHCANLMDPRFDSLGMACTSVPTTTGGTYWTQVLGRAR